MSIVPLIAINAANASNAEAAKAIAWTPEGRLQEAQFAKLVEKGALVEMRRGHWFLNEEKLAASKNGSGVLLVVSLALLALLGWVILMTI